MILTQSGSFPAAYRLPGSGRSYRFNWGRVILLSLLLTLLAAAELYLHHTVLDDFHRYLVGAEKKSMAWMELQLSYMLPFITIGVFQYTVYHKDDRQDGVLRREMAWEVVLVAVLTYAVLLPGVAHMSQAMHDAAVAAGKELPMTSEKVELTLLMSVHDWFVRFSVPLMLLTVYHFARAAHEKELPPEETIVVMPAAGESVGADAPAGAAADDPTGTDSLRT